MKLENMTLRQIKEFCNGQPECDGCKLNKEAHTGARCGFENLPWKWKLKKEVAL